VTFRFEHARGTSKATNFSAFTSLTAAVNLKSFNIDCTSKWDLKPEMVALQLYRCAYHFLEAYGDANGSKDAAVDIVGLGGQPLNSNRHGMAISDDESDPQEVQESHKEQFKARLRDLLGVTKCRSIEAE
jgi:hypothetical protein